MTSNIKAQVMKKTKVKVNITCEIEMEFIYVDFKCTLTSTKQIAKIQALNKLKVMTDDYECKTVGKPKIKVK